MRNSYLLALVALLFQVGVASAQQFPMMDKLADKVVQKYQSSSCQELAQKKSQPPAAKSEMIEQRAVEMLRKDPQMRTEFLNRVAGPIANKMFECGMIPEIAACRCASDWCCKFFQFEPGLCYCRCERTFTACETKLFAGPRWLSRISGSSHARHCDILL
jgi:hypothetical protein